VSAPTLVGRVSRAVALAGVAGAVLVAGISHGLSWRAAVAREDIRLGAAAQTLAAELTGARDGAEADDEDREMIPAGVRISLWQGARRLGGAAMEVGPPGCHAHRWRGARWRRCTVRVGAREIVAASPYAPLEETRDAGALASAVAVALVALVAALAGRGWGRRVVGPLTRLRGAVAAVRADAPDASVLPAPEGTEEVDALREALSTLLIGYAASLTRARRFAADAAHELRTPLGRLRAALELAAEDPALPEAHRAALARMREEARSLGVLAERLLILASPLSAAMVAREAVSLAEVVSEVVDALDAAARARVTLRAEDEGMVRGDPPLLRALVLNAVENALKFAPEGAVTVTVRASPQAVVVRVSDEGVGVPSSLREDLFTPFHRSAAARAAGLPGHGVGLALIAHVARAHGGEARFVDADRGATLEVSLPPWRAAEG
jgi:signal transduction histidine kinase